MASADLEQNLIFWEEYDPFTSPTWTASPPPSGDFLDTVMPFDEAILEAMVGFDRPWEDMHHRSSSLPHFDEMEASTSTYSISSRYGSHLPSQTLEVFSEGNMANITETVAVNISINLIE